MANDIPIRWKVVSSRAYYWGKKIMKPGQVFAAFEKDLPAELRSIVVPIEGTPTSPVMVPPVVVSQPVVIPVPIVYRIREKKGGEFFDVFDSRGKRVNEVQLTKTEAEEMVKKLSE